MSAYTMLSLYRVKTSTHSVKKLLDQNTEHVVKNVFRCDK